MSYQEIRVARQVLPDQKLLPGIGEQVDKALFLIARTPLGSCAPENGSGILGGTTMLLHTEWVAVVLTVASGTGYAQPGSVLAEQQYKNIQILKGVPAADVEPAMEFLTAALGVQCQFCHVEPDDQDTKPTKQTARRMISMTRALNAATFGGAQVVTCYTCHQGRSTLVSVPAVFSGSASPDAPPTAAPPLPRLEEVLDHYIQALGGTTALDKLSTRVIRATQTDATGGTESTQIVQKAPDKLYVETTWPGVTFYTGFDGRTGWRGSKNDNQQVVTLQGTNAKRDEIPLQADFYQAIDLQVRYRDLHVKERLPLGDREAVLIEGKSPDGNLERLYFDTQTGLLVRRYSERQTLFGAMPLETNFEDYRQVDGIKFPFRVRWALPTRAWSLSIGTVQHNVAVTDERFGPPSRGAARQ